MDWRVTTPPASLPLDWPAMKAHLRIASDAERALVLDYVAQATEHAETMMQCSLVDRVIMATYDYGDEIVLARGPIFNVASVKDTAGNDIAYGRRNVGNRSTLTVPNISAMLHPITVVYHAGYATIPADIIGAIRIHAATLYAFREDVTPAAANPVHKLDAFYRFRSRGGLVA